MPQPPEFDGNAILAVLARHKVACVVIGNYAGLLRGVNLATEDVDITPATTAENLERLAIDLAELGAAIRVPASPLSRCPPTLVCSPKPRSGTSRPATATSTSPLGLRIEVAALEDVIRSKTAAGRAKDLAALPQLRAALERQRDAADT